MKRFFVRFAFVALCVEVALWILAVVLGVEFLRHG